MRPTRDSMLMEMAKVVSSRATCSRQSVGVVVAREGRVLVTGYNGAPAGMKHCKHVCDCDPDYEGVRIASGSKAHSITCEVNRPCETSVHAECNAIAYAARYGVSLAGAELFTTFSPCLSCAQLIINAGIARVVYGGLHRDRRGLDLLQNGIVRVDCSRVVDPI